MRILAWVIRIIGLMFSLPIILAFPGFFLFQIAEEIEEAQDRKEGKWR